jgi:hypothetical protein
VRFIGLCGYNDYNGYCWGSLNYLGVGLAKRLGKSVSKTPISATKCKYSFKIE